MQEKRDDYDTERPGQVRNDGVVMKRRPKVTTAHEMYSNTELASRVHRCPDPDCSYYKLGYARPHLLQSHIEKMQPGEASTLVALIGTSHYEGYLGAARQEAPLLTDAQSKTELTLLWGVGEPPIVL
jgi:hypothetical protein